MTIVKVVGLFAKSPDVFLLCHEQEQTWFFIGSASAFVRRFFAHHTVFQLTSLQCFVFLCLCRKQLTFSKKKKNDDSPINEGGKAYFRRWDFTDLYSALAFYTYCILNHISYQTSSSIFNLGLAHAVHCPSSEKPVKQGSTVFGTSQNQMKSNSRRKGLLQQSVQISC